MSQGACGLRVACSTPAFCVFVYLCGWVFRFPLVYSEACGVGGRRLGVALMHAACDAGGKRNELHLIRGNDILHFRDRPKRFDFLHGGRWLGVVLMHAACDAGGKRNELHLIRGNDILHFRDSPKRLDFLHSASNTEWLDFQYQRKYVSDHPC
jgi:hypothetical protein